MHVIASAPSRDALRSLRTTLRSTGARVLCTGRKLVDDPCEADEVKVILSNTSTDMLLHMVVHMKRAALQASSAAQIYAAFKAAGGPVAAGMAELAAYGACHVVPYYAADANKIPDEQRDGDGGVARYALVDGSQREAHMCRLTASIGLDAPHTLVCDGADLRLSAPAWEAQMRRLAPGCRRLVVTVTGAGAFSVEAKEMSSDALALYVRRMVDSAAAASVSGFHIMLGATESVCKRRRRKA